MVIGLAVMAGVIFMEQAQRRIPVQYAKRMVGRRLLGGTTTYIPIKVNQAGVIPVIFASSMLYLPVLYAQFQPGTADSPNPVANWIAANLSSGSWIYELIFFLLIIFFTYFYVSITFDPVEVSDNMKKYGGFIPGVRAGGPTERYLAHVLSRLTAPGSLYLGIVALIPAIAFISLGTQNKFPFGGTSILIIVGVGLDTVKQIQSQLQQRNYEGFLR
jgi:preprotein translocase subunit SecY